MKIKKLTSTFGDTRTLTYRAVEKVVWDSVRHSVHDLVEDAMQSAARSLVSVLVADSMWEQHETRRTQLNK
jgi:hypothetical protein